MSGSFFTFSQRTKLLNYLFDLAKRQEFRGNAMMVKENGYQCSGDLTAILETAIDLLDEDSKRIIINDFKVKTNKHWWQFFYSRSTYYRLKTKATQDLLSFLHNC